MPAGETTPDHHSSDGDRISFTDVDRALVARLTPIEVDRLTTALGEIRATTPSGRDLGLAPTPRVEVSAGLVRERAPTAARILGGRYRLGRQLGAGGYGTVFAAEDAITGERVAIKVLSPAASRNHELIIRFHREAIAASRVRHPHIVSIADFDLDDDDGHYIVMEHLDGKDLAQVLADAGRLEPQRALVVAAQCARGLAAAHRAGVLHRDLKPANVFLVRGSDRRELVKVIDFGISKLTPLAGDYTDVTSNSKVVGTPSYMSPEQARGRQLDARTDVYALGVMLFEMLVGERPFTGRSPLEILGNHLSAPRVAPSLFRSELAAWPGLDEIVLRAIAADPALRYSSMEELGEALVACLAAVTPEAAERVSEPTGEQTARNRLVRDDDVTSTVVRPATSKRPLRAIIALVSLVAATLVMIGWLVHDPATDAPPPRDAPAVAPPVLAPVPAPLAPAPPAPAPRSPAPARADRPASPSLPPVRITSTPTGAVVYRGGRRVGVTPLTLDGDRASAESLTLDAPGYRSRSVNVVPDRDQLNVVLSPLRPAKPAVRTTPTTPTTRGVSEW